MTTDSTASITKLRFAFQEIRTRTASLSSSELASLRGRVCQVVHDQKNRGTLPERIIVIVRQIAAEAGVTITGNTSLEVVIRWCVDEYYPEPAATEVA